MLKNSKDVLIEFNQEILKLRENIISDSYFSEKKEEINPSNGVFSLFFLHVPFEHHLDAFYFQIVPSLYSLTYYLNQDFPFLTMKSFENQEVIFPLRASVSR
mgnify:CR=1 FL=1